MKKISRVVVALLCVAGSAGAMAQGVFNRPQLSAALANELVGDAVAICASRGYKVWAVVVNLDGTRQALLRGDGAPIHSQDNSYNKAYTAASLTLGRNENSTKELADRMGKAKPSTVPYSPLPHVTFARGAIVIRDAGGHTIGAIGVSGAPGGQFDEACAREALAKIQDQIQ